MIGLSVGSNGTGMGEHVNRSRLTSLLSGFIFLIIPLMCEMVLMKEQKVK